jgi:hypothetical protein
MLDLPELLRASETTTGDRAADEIERLRAQITLLERQFGEYVERFLSDVECTNSERRRYKKALEQIEDLNPAEARESFGIAHTALNP